MRVLPALVVLGMFIAGCAQVSQVVDEPVFGAAEGKIEDASPVEVEITPLTNSVAATLNAREAQRRVLQVGGGRAEEVNAGALLSVTPLPTLDPIPYRIGVGDTLSLARFITARGFTDDIAREQVVTSSSKVSADGSILFIETGRISIEGLTLAEARELAANALIRNGIDPRFQLEVSGFNSQSVALITESAEPAGGAGVSVTVSETTKGTGSYPIVERPLSLRELLVQAGLTLQSDSIQVVRVSRAGKVYAMPLAHVFDGATPEYYLTGGDLVRISTYGFARDVAYAFGGGSQPLVVPIGAERVHLADALFSEGGVLASPASRKREIYLLRGRAPIRAYHLDANDPARVSVATQLELRPNDIVFAATKPIYEAGTFLSLINPFRALLTGVTAQ